MSAYVDFGVVMPAAAWAWWQCNGCRDRVAQVARARCKRGVQFPHPLLSGEVSLFHRSAPCVGRYTAPMSLWRQSSQSASSNIWSAPSSL
jgi:hypothetical protein